MSRQQRIIGLTAAAIALAAGTLIAQGQQPGDARPGNTLSRALGDKSMSVMNMEFWSTIKGTDLYNEAGTKVGELDNLVIDRGNGQVQYLVVDTTKEAGRDGKTLLLNFRPMRLMDKDADKSRITVSAADFAAASEFDKSAFRDRWSFFRSKNKEATYSEDDRAVAEALARRAALEQADIYYTQWPRDAKTIRVEGDVLRIERRYVDNAGEYQYVVVHPKTGEDQTVVLGPAWHVMGNEVVPVRGSTFAGDVVRLPNGDLVVVSSKIDGREIRYRDPQGVAVWTTKVKEDEHAHLRGRYLLATDLKGKNVDLRDNKVGEIQDLVVEVGSGRIAFASIDPNKNFLGIGDTDRLIPWTLVYSRPDGKVTVDATKEMLVTSMATPKDIHQLSQADAYRGAYTPFNTTPYTYTYRDSATDMGIWARDGAIGRAIRDAKTHEIDGKVVSVSRGREPISNSDATILTLNVDGQQRIVVLAPSMATDARAIKAGDEVVIEVWEVRPATGSQPALVARRITHDGKHVASWGGSPD